MVLGLVGICQAALASSGCGRPTRPPNILLISLDACRADHLGAYGYSRNTTPFIDSLAARGTLFANAFVNTLGTPPSHTTMLSSLYQETHRVQYNERQGLALARIPGEVTLLQERLQRSGYTTLGVTGGGWMAGKYGYARGFTAFDDRWKGEGVGAGELFRMVSRHATADRPVFAFLHTYYIHSPYSPPPEYRRLWGDIAGRFEATSENLYALNMGKLEASERDVRFITAMYDAGIRRTDDALRMMFANLRRLGFFDDYLVVITADHGEELGERGRFLHPGVLYDDLLHVPLILEGTAVPRGKVDRSLASGVDITPTILRAAGIEADAPLEGRDLLRSPAPDAVFAQFRGWRYAIRTQDWKLIAHQKPAALELYDLRSDPGERSNLVGELPEKAQTLERRLREWRRSRPSLQSLTAPDVEVSDDDVDRLRALGYVN